MSEHELRINLRKPQPQLRVNMRDAADRERWQNARAFAEGQGSDAATALDYADWIREGVDSGHVTMAARHADLFPQWLAWADKREREGS